MVFSSIENSLETAASTNVTCRKIADSGGVSFSRHGKLGFLAGIPSDILRNPPLVLDLLEVRISSCHFIVIERDSRLRNDFLR